MTPHLTKYCIFKWNPISPTGFYSKKLQFIPPISNFCLKSLFFLWFLVWKIDARLDLIPTNFKDIINEYFDNGIIALDVRRNLSKDAIFTGFKYHYFFWGFLKDEVPLKFLSNIRRLENETRSVLSGIDSKMLQKVIRNFMKLLQYALMADGALNKNIN